MMFFSERVTSKSVPKKKAAQREILFKIVLLGKIGIRIIFVRTGQFGQLFPMNLDHDPLRDDCENRYTWQNGIIILKKETKDIL